MEWILHPQKWLLQYVTLIYSDNKQKSYSTLKKTGACGGHLGKCSIGHNSVTFCPISIIFTFLQWFWNPCSIEHKHDLIFPENKKLNFLGYACSPADLWPPWEGSKNQFKNLKKLHNAYNVECNQEIPGEHDFSKKVKKWATLTPTLAADQVKQRDLPPKRSVAWRPTICEIFLLRTF